ANTGAPHIIVNTPIAGNTSLGRMAFLLRGGAWHGYELQAKCHRPTSPRGGPDPWAFPAESSQHELMSIRWSGQQVLWLPADASLLQKRRPVRHDGQRLRRRVRRRLHDDEPLAIGGHDVLIHVAR